MKMRLFCIILLLSCTAWEAFAQDWYSVNVKPSSWNVDFDDVHFFDERNGWAVGDQGTIIRTLTGSGWHNQISGVDSDLHGVHFTSVREGWVIGDYGIILHTNDGGITWGLQQSGTSEYLYDIYFVREDCGWIAGARGTILYWDGNRWSKQQCPTDSDLFGLYFYNVSNGWAVGEKGTILYWNGSRWLEEQSDISEDLHGIFALSRYDVWAVGDRGIILRSDGATWRIWKQQTPFNDLKSINFPDKQYGWITGDRGTILYTDNYGINWKTQKTPVTNNLNALHPLSLNKIWVVGDNGAIVQTIDGGISWESFENPPYGDFQDVSFAGGSIQDGWVVGEDGAILYTKKGETWYEQPSPTYNTLYGVCFLDKDNGWAVGDVGTIIRTNDGITWKIEPSLAGAKKLRSVYFTDLNNGWVVGDLGTILYWNGTDWKIQTGSTINDLYAVHFITSNDGWVVGDGGTILHTSDGGLNWVKVASGTYKRLRDVHFIDSEHGWVVGDGGTILHYDKGNIELQDTGIKSTLYDVDSLSITQCWVAGEDRVTLTTRNGGDKWELRVAPLAVGDLYGIDFTDWSFGIAVGENGSVAGYAGTTPPAEIELLSPRGNITTLTPTFRWESSRPDLVHTVFIDKDTDPFRNPLYAFTVKNDTSFTLSQTNALEKGTYYWGVETEDNTRSTPEYLQFIAWPPTKITPNLPVGYISETTPTFQWDCNNKELESLTYTLFIDKDETPYDGKSISVGRDLSHKLASSDPIQSLSEGKYGWGVRAEHAGTFTDSPVITFVVDLSPPTGMVEINSGARFTNSLKVTLRLSASDPLTAGNIMGVGVTQYQISNNGSTWSDPEVFSSEIMTKTWDLSGYGGDPKDGLKTVYVRYKDGLEHWSEPVKDDINLDTVLPTGTILINNGAEITGEKEVTLALSASDVGSGIEPGGKMMLSNDGNKWSPPLIYESIRKWDISLSEYGGNENEGIKTVYVKFMDAAENWMKQPVSDTIKLDKTGPKGTILINDGEEETNSLLVKLILSASDESGVKEMRFSNGGDNWSPPEPYKTTRENWDLSQYGGNPKDGEKMVYVRFIDSVGNETVPSAEDSIFFKSSVSVSELQISPPKVEGKVRNGDVVQVSGKTEQGIEVIAKEVLDESGKSIDLDLSGVVYEAETGLIKGVFSLGVLTAKTIQLKLTVKDKLGNQADAASNILTVDNEPPINISVKIDRKSPTNTTFVSLNISATGAYGMYVDGDIDRVFEVDNGLRNWILYRDVLKIKLKDNDGIKEVRVKFRDDVGNESVEVSDRITLDTIPPTGTVVINNGNELVEKFAVTLILSAVDINGVESYQLSNDGNVWSQVFPYSEDVLEWDLGQFGGSRTDGLHIVYAKYKDKAGNWSAPTSDNITVDATAPIISLVKPRLEDKQEAMNPVVVAVIVEDNRALTEVDLHYRRKGPYEYTVVAMTRLSGNNYGAEIPGREVTLDGVEYYLSASDGLLTSTLPPKDAPISPYFFTVIDTTPPNIEHEPVGETPVKSSPKIIARVTDSVKVGRVTLFHKIQSDRNFTKIEMTSDTGGSPDEYSASIPAMAVPGAVQYYIEAVDSSSNLRTVPVKGAKDPYNISFVDIEPPEIVHTLIPDGQEAGKSILIGATITDNVGVENVTFKYRVPGRDEFVETKMTRVGSYYSAEIPGDVVMPGKIDYSITADDLSRRSGDAQVTHSFTVVDNTAPTIELTLAPSQIEVNKDISIQAKVTDNVKVEVVSLYYKNVEDTKFNVASMRSAGNRYSATIPGQKKTGEVKYYVYARDSQGISSTEPPIDPENVPRVITIIDVSSPIIEHSPVVGAQEAGLAVTITATVTDDVQVADVSLHHRRAGQESFKIAPMMETETKSLYGGSIPDAEVVPTGLEYYIKASDGSSNVTTHPADNPDKLPHSFRVVDTVPPEIVYDPSKLTTVLITDPIVVTTEATDRTGIKQVKVFYKMENELSFSSQVCKDLGNNRFSVTIPSPPSESRIGYYIQAEDNSGNISTSPEQDPTTQPYSVFVDDPFPPLPPTRLSAIPTPGGKVKLIWEPSKSSDTDKYNVYTDSGSGTVDYSVVYDSVDSSKNSYESPPLGDGVYKFAVRAVDKSGNEENNTVIVSIIADAVKPEPATNLVATSRPNGRIELSWKLSLSKDAAVYNIYWDNAQAEIDYSKPLARVNDPGTMWTSDKLRDGVVYRFVVRCEDRAGNEEESTTFASTRADATPPENVTELSSPTHKLEVWSNQPKIKVIWTPAKDSITGLAGYSASWDSQERTLPDEVIDIPAGVTSQELPDDVCRLTPDSCKLYFHIRSVDKAGNWSDEASHLGFFLIDIQTPQPPTNLLSISQPGGRIKLSWTASESADVVRYNIYWDSGTGRGIDYSKPIATTTSNDWTSSVLEDGKMYEFSVRAEDRASNEEKNTTKSASVADSQPPSIAHKPIILLLEQEIMSVTIYATVDDASGLDKVEVHYRKHGDERYMDKEMLKEPGNIYKGEIPSSVFSSAEGVDYYISANDKAGNVSTYPVTTIAIVKSLQVLIDPAKENEIMLGDGSSLYFPAGAVPAGTHLNITIPRIIPEPQTGLGKHIIAREFSLDKELSKPINIMLYYNDEKVSGENESKLSMYLWDGHRWNYLLNVNPQENSAIATTMKSGIFSIIGDYEPPSVANLQPSGYAESDVRITAQIKDNGSGVDPKNIEVTLDGGKLEVPGSTFSEDELSLVLPKKLNVGQHSLRIIVRDNVGNQAETTSRFEVTGELVLRNVFCYPNPFKPARGANFAYTLTEPANNVTIRIFGMDGKLVRKLEGSTLIGENVVPWNCEDEEGELVLSSVYICQIEAEGSRETVVETIKIAGWE